MGTLDAINDELITGWAESPNGSDQPATVDIYIDDEIAGETVADLFRDDLQEKGIRDGYAGFRFPIPLNFFDGREHCVRITVRGSDQPLWNCPFNFRGSVREMRLIQDRADWIERAVLLRPSRRANLLGDRIRERKKVALLATFHSAPKFLGYHFALAKLFAEAGFVVVILHSTAIVAPSLAEIDRDDCFLYVKRNLGYDFGSWAVGIWAISDFLDDVEEIVLVNDSIIGLRPGLTDVLEQIRNRNADVVGLTDSYERSYHLQSYFLWLGRRVCQSAPLQVFMAKYPFTSEKDVVVREGELGLSRFFQEQGFTLNAIYQYEKVAGAWLEKASQVAQAIEGLPAFRVSTDWKSYRNDLLEKLEGIVCSVIRGTPLNPSHYFWDMLLDFGFPFVKRELVMVNPGDVPTYFQFSEVLRTLPPQIQGHILEVRQIYGGQRVPFVAAPREPNGLHLVDRDRRRTERGALVG